MAIRPIDIKDQYEKEIIPTKCLLINKRAARIAPINDTSEYDKPNKTDLSLMCEQGSR